MNGVPLETLVLGIKVFCESEKSRFNLNYPGKIAGCPIKGWRGGSGGAGAASYLLFN